jgi:hypothetical protein
MKVTSVLSRRTLLATALASAAPRLGFGQAQSERAIMKIECAFSDHVFAVSLYENPSARDLASMLPRRRAISAITLRGATLHSFTPIMRSRAADPPWPPRQRFRASCSRGASFRSASHACYEVRS